MYITMFIAGFFTAIFLLLITSDIRARRRRKKRLSRKERKRVKIDTYVKAATSIVLAHGLIMVTMSYVLAWFEKDAVVDVSTTLITEIVAPLCLYIGTNCIMNIFEKNELSFSKPIQMQSVREAWDKTNSDSDADPDEGAAG